MRLFRGFPACWCALRGMGQAYGGVHLRYRLRMGNSEMGSRAMMISRNLEQIKPREVFFLVRIEMLGAGR